MRTLLKLAATTFVWGIATIGSAQTLWHDLHYGMSVAEVKKLLPQAKDVSNSRINDGTIERLNIGQYRMAKKDFAVHLRFSALENRLAAVSLSLGEYADVATVRETFEALSREFREKYGHEVKSEPLRDLPNKSGITGYAAWLSGYTKIDIFVSPLTRTTAEFFVGYRVECPSSNPKRDIVQLQCPEIVANKVKGQKEKVR